MSGVEQERTRRFCSEHRTHFCPCVQPGLYKAAPRAARAWDEPQAVKLNHDGEAAT